MNQRPAHATASPDEASVLTKAVTRAAALLGITQRQLAGALGLSAPTASRLFAGKYRLSPARSKEWELGVLFVRLFRSLDALWGHEDTARAWLTTHFIGAIYFFNGHHGLLCDRVHQRHR